MADLTCINLGNRVTEIDTAFAVSFQRNDRKSQGQNQIGYLFLKMRFILSKLGRLKYLKRSDLQSPSAYPRIWSEYGRPINQRRMKVWHVSLEPTWGLTNHGQSLWRHDNGWSIDRRKLLGVSGFPGLQKEVSLGFKDVQVFLMPNCR